MSLRSCDAVFYNLAAVLVTSNLGKVFYNRLIDHCAFVVRFQKNEALANDVASADVTAQVYDSSIFKCFMQKSGCLICSSLILNQLVL